MESWAGHHERAIVLRPRRESATANMGTSQHQNGTQQTSRRNKKPAQQDASLADGADLLHSTAKLALETARKLRCLSAVVVRTVAIPDSTPCGQKARILAEQARSYIETEHAYAWAQLVLIVLAAPSERMPAEALAVLRQHATASTSAAGLTDHVGECTLTRCYDGQWTNLRLVTDSELSTVTRALLQCLVGLGCGVRFGAAPRSTNERNVSHALSLSSR